MLIYNINQMKNGWIVGNFYPSCFVNHDFEVCHAKHKAGEKSDGHHHKIATEINYILKGNIKLYTGHFLSDGSHWIISLSDGAVWVTEPNKVYGIEFVEDTELIVMKTPSVPGDKYKPDNTPSDPKLSEQQKSRRQRGLEPLYKEQLEDLQNWLPSNEAAREYFHKFPVK